MATVRRLMEAKSDEHNYYVNGTDTVYQALELMSKANIGAVLVKDGERFVGIFTERDYARKGELLGRSAKETFVKDLMTEKMVTIHLDTSVDQCMAMMLKYRIRHLPVVENEHLVGLVSMRDVVEAVVSNKETLIKDLENYIMGNGFIG
jgi:CBS domain-containing protein